MCSVSMKSYPTEFCTKGVRALGSLPSHCTSQVIPPMWMGNCVTRMTQLPIHIGGITWEVQWEGKDPKARTPFVQNSVGYDFIETLHIRLLQGRDFSERFPTDTSNYLINETAARIMHLAN